MSDTPRFPVAVLALGVLFSAVGAWIYLRQINRWSLVFGQLGLVYIVVGAGAYAERNRTKLSGRSLALVTVLPGLVTVLLLLVLGASVDELFPYGPLLGPVPTWILAAFGVPWLFVLGRAQQFRQQWLIARLVGLLVAIPFLYFTLSSPGLLYMYDSGFTLMLAICFWTAILPYELGKANAKIQGGSNGSILPPALLGTFTCSILFLTLVQTDQLSLYRSFDPGMHLRDAILFGPFVYLAVRGAVIVLQRGTELEPFGWFRSS